MNPDSKAGEATIQAGLERLNEQLRQAQQSAAGQGRNPEEALDQVERLRRQVDELARQLGTSQTGLRRAANPLTGPAREGNAQAGLSRGGNPQSGGVGADGRDADGLRAAAGGPLGDGHYVAGYDPGGFSWPQGKERQPVPVTQADLERAFEQAQRDLNELRNTVRSEPGPLPDIQDLIRELNRLDPRRFPGNPAMLDDLHAQVLSSVDKIELRLRRDLDEKQTGEVRTGDNLRVPPGYQDAVAEYFRRLSKSPEGGK